MSIAKLQRRLLGGANRIDWSSDDWARLARHFDYEGPIPPLLTKRSNTPQVLVALPELEKSTAGSMEVYKFTISDGGTDHAMDQIAVPGWDWSVFGANPLVQYAHAGDALPVGRAIWTGIEGGRLKSKMIFSSDVFAQRVKRLVDERVLRATSVGFKPGEWEFARDKARPGGINFTRGHQLLEWSIVNVPCNPRCLLEGVEGAKDGAAVIEQAEVPPAATPFRDEATARLAELRRQLAKDHESIHAPSSDTVQSSFDETSHRLASIRARAEQLRRINKS